MDPISKTNLISGVLGFILTVKYLIVNWDRANTQAHQ